MKKVILIAMMVIANQINAQSIDKIKYQIDSLYKTKKRLESELTNTVSLIESKSKILSELQTQEFDKSLTLKAIKELTALDIKSTANGKKVFTIKKGEVFKVLNFDNDFYTVEYLNFTGFVYYISLNGIPELEEFKAYCIKRNAEIKKAQDLAAKSDLNSKRSIELAEKFGSQYATAILQGKIWKGMTDAMATESIGSPEKVNRSTGSFGVHEQWIYKNKYLYFENGILTSWQEQN